MSRLLLMFLGVVLASRVEAQRSSVQRPRAPIEILAPARTSAPITLRLSPSVDVAMDDSDAEFDARSGLFSVLPRGRSGWIVLEGQTIHAFDGAGRRLASVGGSGSGPGEFRALGGGCTMPGDSVAVYDPVNRRFSVLSPELRHQRVVESRPGSPLAAFTCLGDGRIVTVWVSATDARRMQLSVEIIGPDPRTRQSIAELDGGPWTGLARPSASVFSVGDLIYVAPAIQSEIIELDDSGSVLRVLRTADALVETRPADLDASLERMLPLGASRASRDAMRARLQRNGVPLHWPAHGRVFAGDRGEVWIEDYGMPQATASLWTRLDSTWTITGRLSVPRQDANGRVDVLGFSRGLVLLWERDSDGFSRIVGRGMLER